MVLPAGNLYLKMLLLITDELLGIEVAIKKVYLRAPGSSAP